MYIIRLKELMKEIQYIEEFDNITVYYQTLQLQLQLQLQLKLHELCDLITV